MCGVIGITGTILARSLLLRGLKLADYRGYDSMGVAIQTLHGVYLRKFVGPANDFEVAIGGEIQDGTTGIAHARWATHGPATEANAHPHGDCKGNVYVVHNGMIVNYREIKAELIEKGHVFKSETDTESIPHLIEQIRKDNPDISFEDAVRMALKRIDKTSTYTFIVLDIRNPGVLIAAANSTILRVGITDNGYIVASDTAPILLLTKRVVDIESNEMMVIRPDGYNVLKINGSGKKKAPKDIYEIQWTLDEATKEGYSTYLEKEIREQSMRLKDATGGRLNESTGSARLGGIEKVMDKIGDLEQLYLVGCGTSYHSCLVAEEMFAQYVPGLRTKAIVASEFEPRPEHPKGCAGIFVSQSGETEDVIKAIKKAKKERILTLGIINVVGSKISGMVDAGSYLHFGPPEVSVASTKAFVGQLAVFVELVLIMARKRGMTRPMGQKIVRGMKEIPELINLILDGQDEVIKKIVKKYAKYNDWLFTARGPYDLPVAQEIRLKTEELTYTNADYRAGGEVKHGPLAKLGPKFPTVCMVPDPKYRALHQAVLSDIKILKARGVPVIAIAVEGDDIKSEVDDAIFVPRVSLPVLYPFVKVVAGQLFALRFAETLKRNVDKPRWLAKSVTVG